MFGKEYHHEIDLLFESFGAINKDYSKQVLRERARNPVFTAIQRLYIRIFGIPEVGFQTRSLYVQKILNTHAPQDSLKRILDVGSGIGAYVFWLAKKYKKALVTGGEIDEDKLKYSKLLQTKLHVYNAKFTYLDITKSNTKIKYDLIVTIDVLEHVSHYNVALHNLYKLLHRGGFLYIHVPQPNQKRILRSLRRWHHEDHVREGISREVLEKTLKKIGYTIIISRETFGFFGKLAWELNHIMLSKNFMLAGITFPFLYVIALLDLCWKNENGLGVAVLAKK